MVRRRSYSRHQTPPFMGQGMCSGLRDASNLAWKLDWVLKGRAAESLLDTYQSERLPHARAYIDTAVRLGSIIQATDPEVARKRDEEMLRNPPKMESIQPPLGPGLHCKRRRQRECFPRKRASPTAG